MDIAELYALLQVVQDTIKAKIQDVGHTELIVTLPHARYVELGKLYPLLSREGEPFLELGAGDCKIVLTSAEAMGLTDVHAPAGS